MSIEAFAWRGLALSANTLMSTYDFSPAELSRIWNDRGQKHPDGGRWTRSRVKTFASKYAFSPEELDEHARRLCARIGSMLSGEKP